MALFLSPAFLAFTLIECRLPRSEATPNGARRRPGTIRADRSPVSGARGSEVLSVPLSNAFEDPLASPGEGWSFRPDRHLCRSDGAVPSSEQANNDAGQRPGLKLGFESRATSCATASFRSRPRPIARSRGLTIEGRPISDPSDDLRFAPRLSSVVSRQLGEAGFLDGRIPTSEKSFDDRVARHLIGRADVIADQGGLTCFLGEFPDGENDRSSGPFLPRARFLRNAVAFNH